ncbi:uncharacterized protein [Mytilus edulis]|uniref:uncharacterized protein n=1 Tax=Mytilus edulis TaxID=6550 RepID=UPI0039EFD65E
MSDDSCIQCQNVVRPRQEALQCDGCQKWQHRTCNSGVPRDQYRQAVKDHAQLEWKCVTCTEIIDEDPSIVIDRSFDIPEQVQEDSIADESIGDIPEDDPTVHYQTIEEGSNRGKRKLCDSDGFNYTVKKQKNDHILWRCTKRNKTINCPATVIQDGDNFKPGMKEHVHPAEPGSVIAVMIKKELLSSLSRMKLEYTRLYIRVLKLVSEGKLQRYQRKQSRQTQGRLFALWDEYCNNSISASRLLKECASVYGPPPK